MHILTSAVHTTGLIGPTGPIGTFGSGSGINGPGRGTGSPIGVNCLVIAIPLTFYKKKWKKEQYPNERLK